MKIIFDHGTPVPLRRYLSGHAVSTAFEMGWHQLENGALLTVAEAAFDSMITTDQSLQYQQNLTRRQLAILVLPTTSWPIIEQHVTEVVAAVAELRPGDFCELTFD